MAINQYSFVNNSQDSNQKRISMNGVLKPLPIGSISFIVNATPQILQNKIMYQLSRLEQLNLHLTQQVNDPRYIKVKQRNMVDLKILKQCQMIHKNYFNKVIYYKNKTMNANPQFLNNLQRQYTMQLFQLNQQYQKIRLQMKGVDPNARQI